MFVFIVKEMLVLMKLGSVVVDMVVMLGGNVEGFVVGDIVEINGVMVIGNGYWS